jgi:uncharacterized protein (UPF0254 family)
MVSVCTTECFDFGYPAVRTIIVLRSGRPDREPVYIIRLKLRTLVRCIEAKKRFRIKKKQTLQDAL